MKKILLVLGILSITIPNNAQTNLIKNGGFETELLNWRGEGIATISPYDKKTGNNSCTINQFVGAEWKGIDQIVSIPKKTVAIEFSGWVKAAGIEKGQNVWNTGKFDMAFLNAGEKEIQNESIASVLGTTPWTFYKKTVTVPAGASKFRIMLALGQTNGTIFFDDLKAVALTQEQLDKIQAEENARKSGDESTKLVELSNANFENGIASWRGNATVSTSIYKEGKSALVLNSSTFDWTGIDQIADIPENVTSITISGWSKSDNIKQGKDAWNNGLIALEFTTIDGTKTGEGQNLTFVTGTTDWTQHTKTFPIPGGAKKYRIMIALGFASGTLYADDISIHFK
ncbi:hypothetical protein [Flavobacterium adhaerens]|uniref:hypothetical protein n=1 Tax=Flavobacterium adhaerens TaxID=3149043 RepID=UPI0032B42838